MASISVPTALAIGSTVAGVGGSILQSGAISGAAGKATAAQREGAAIQRNDLMPYAAQGLGATNRAADLLGLGTEDGAAAAMDRYKTSPGYQWQMDQGLRAVDHAAAARGILRSGDTLKAEQTYGAGLADSDFSNYYNRLFSMAKLGEDAAAGQGSGAIATGRGIAETEAGAGGAQASIYGNAAKGLQTGLNALYKPDLATAGGSGYTFGTSGWD